METGPAWTSHFEWFLPSVIFFFEFAIIRRKKNEILHKKKTKKYHLEHLTESLDCQTTEKKKELLLALNTFLSHNVLHKLPILYNLISIIEKRLHKSLNFSRNLITISDNDKYSYACSLLNNKLMLGQQ